VIAANINFGGTCNRMKHRQTIYKFYFAVNNRHFPHYSTYSWLQQPTVPSGLERGHCSTLLSPPASLRNKVITPSRTIAEGRLMGHGACCTNRFPPEKSLFLLNRPRKCPRSPPAGPEPPTDDWKLPSIIFPSQTCHLGPLDNFHRPMSANVAPDLPFFCCRRNWP